MICLTVVISLIGEGFCFVQLATWRFVLILNVQLVFIRGKKLIKLFISLTRITQDLSRLAWFDVDCVTSSVHAPCACWLSSLSPVDRSMVNMGYTDIQPRAVVPSNRAFARYGSRYIDIGNGVLSWALRDCTANMARVDSNLAKPCNPSSVSPLVGSSLLISVFNLQTMPYRVHVLPASAPEVGNKIWR